MLKIIVCRRASDPLKPGSVLGFACRSCEKALAVTPIGVAHLQSGGVPFCNACGFAIAKKLDPATTDFELTPQALEQLLKELERNCVP